MAVVDKKDITFGWQRLGHLHTFSRQCRIAANPALYEALSPKHKNLVAEGRLAESMPKTAVFLAWGTPDRRGSGFREGVSFDRWDYTRLQAVHSTAIGGWGGRRGRCYGWGGYGPSVTYIPYRSATVWFHNERADSWERIGASR